MTWCRANTRYLMIDTPRFGADPQAFFETVYAATPPWDIGDVQPDLAALLQAHPPEGPALDLGCGPGDHAIHLARLGLQTTGVDFVEAAIVTARERAAAQPDDVRARLEFLRADARRPSGLARRFRTVLDSGFLHVFEPLEGRAIVEDVTRVLEPGGRYYLLVACHRGTGGRLHESHRGARGRDGGLRRVPVTARRTYAAAIVNA